MGSKARILDFIFEKIAGFRYDSVLDAFSGSGIVAYEFKKRGKEVTTNDFLQFSSEISKAVIENPDERLGKDDLAKLLVPRTDAMTRVRDSFVDVYFSAEECYFLDSLWTNISDLPASYKKDLAIAAACRACQKRYPRGIFTVTGNKGRDHRRDFQIGLSEHFENAVQLFDEAVFDNGRRNRAFCGNIMEFKKRDFDLVYLDPPYWTPLSDNDYVRRYHFIEGYSKYWKGLRINEKTKTKKFDSSYYPTPFRTRQAATAALKELFENFANSILVLSYSSNSFPDVNELKQMMSKVKENVLVEREPHRYSFANQRGTVGRIRNRVDEYLFLGYDKKQTPGNQLKPYENGLGQ